MPELQFKGKEFVYNHHLPVPYRPLVPDPEKSIGDASLNGNLIIHGDNLHALKALLPMYAGEVDCIFIDPPYNTGNEGWSYNDNVNSPMMKEWLSSNPINSEDMLRHDKWCAMMWPRLVLLRELLSENGSFWMTIDDNEVHHARSLLDEIFGERNFVATCLWHKVDSPKNTAEFFSVDHDYILVYSRDISRWKLNLLPRTEEMLARYKNPDNDPRGPWLLSDLAARNPYSEGIYSIKTPSGRIIEGPPAGSYWRVSRKKFDTLEKDGRIWWGENGANRPGIKRFLSEVKSGVVPQTLWHWEDVGSTRNSKQALSQIMAVTGTEDLFITPKPVGLLERILAIATDEGAMVLDSFAGSGTTAHAVLSANAKDLGDRRFILVEGEEYADQVTARRVRKVIEGYEFTGISREELLREQITAATLSRITPILERADIAQNSRAGDFDSIKRVVRDAELIVYGESRVHEKVSGLGGTFTYCTLGLELNVEAILTGADMPAYLAVAAWLFHTATGESFNPDHARPGDFFVGESSAYTVWLVYRPDLDFLKSATAALTAPLAETIAASRAPGKKHLVFAPAKYIPNHKLQPMGIEYAPLPFALYRIEKS